ncbi:hypothetical protein [Mycobacterium servetii]|uniref:4Fe-4S Wbl-type domain-containing protein n=1 Tax=Mycobacterium servetii TaxID=3237418 RepID=A0ABV4C1S6_9MYCO
MKLVLSDRPDSIDYLKIAAAWRMARDTDRSVVVHRVCFECPAVATIAPAAAGGAHRIAAEHEGWCPVLAAHGGRALTARERRRHRRYMDGEQLADPAGEAQS